MILALALPLCTTAQNHPHYTMFMYNKLIYNPAYAGNKNLTSVNALYRNQWVGIDGAPRTFNLAVDGPVGSYMKAFRPVALGFSLNSEQIGVTSQTNITGYYAYRIPMERTVLSFGLQAGVSLYTARYSELNMFQPDPRLTQDIRNALLPNFGPGVFWSGERFYVGAAIPNLLENYYDKERKDITPEAARQVRSYFLSGGYVFSLSEDIKLQPQALLRYAGNGRYQLPLNGDFNLSCIVYDRLMIGATYRTDKSIAGIVHMQVTRQINIGYSYDYAVSELNGYNRGTHEVMAGFDFVRDLNKYANPRFIKSF
jgi:type IX secretion system PorP/SprF family membrane protein